MTPAWLVAVCAIGLGIVGTACRERERERERVDTTQSAEAAAPAKPEQIAIPAGNFLFGCDVKRDRSCKPDEQPQVTLHLPAYSIDRTEVTQAAYQRCIDDNRCASPSAGFTPERTPRHAVTNVTWSEARAYCAWRGARLPTEAEWEKAARGTDGRTYPWGDGAPSCELADFTRCARPRSPVGSFPGGKSPYGVLDMAGGVDEWVADEYISRASASADAKRGERVARGGAYDAWHMRATARSALDPGHHSADLGFRCAR